MTLGTDFSGLETIAWALRTLRLGYRHLFGSDIEASSRKVMSHLGVEQIFEDINGRDVAGLPSSDIYCIGAPCQPFSRQGHGKGIRDPGGRGVLLLQSLAYISIHKPRLVILEQVPQFLQDENHAELRDLTLSELEQHYEVSVQILSSACFGVPQDRLRCYIVAVRQDCPGGFCFPKPVHCPRLEDFIDKLPEEEFAVLPKQGLARESVQACLQPLVDRGVNVFNQAFLVTAGQSTRFAHASPMGRACTITRSEAGRESYWCPFKGGFLSTREIARLQGFPDGLIAVRDLGISERQYRLMLGNAMTFTVVLRILPNALKASGLVDAKNISAVCVRDCVPPNRTRQRAWSSASAAMSVSAPGHTCGSRCPCKRFGKLSASDYPILSAEVTKKFGPELVLKAKELSGQTWVNAVEEDSCFKVGCCLCSELLAEKDRDIVGRYGIVHVEGLKPARLQQHACSAAHLAAVGRLLQPDETVGMPLSCTSGAPALADFDALLQWIRRGGSLRDGVPGVGHFKKAKCMQFVLAESLKNIYRGWIRGSFSVNLLRDERKGRLYVRFRCANLMAERGVGILGQCRVVQSTATNVTEATKLLFAQFCTRFYNAPYTEATADIDIKDFEHLRHSIYALTVDAAGNEVASGVNMQSHHSSTAMRGQALTPNLMTIVRDKAHASRRILERPWACDTYLSAVAGSLISESCSVAQLVQHSLDHRAWFTECCRESACQTVSTVFTNMRAAKHRYESLATPLARMCLDWPAVIAFLVRVVTERPNDTSGRAAQAILQGLDNEMILQAGMLADAADECLVLVRWFDHSEVDNSKIAATVKTFLERLEHLFVGQYIWTAHGYTQATLDFLRGPPTHFYVAGEMRSVGGPQSVSTALRATVLQRMQAWHTIVKEVVSAEHPDFELVSCFRCCDLEEFPRPTQENARHGLPTKFDEPLQRLASAFHLDKDLLKLEFFDLGAIAVAHFREKECSNLDGWKWALKVTASPAARAKHPVDNLQILLAHYAAMSSSDSIIERDFSRVQKLLSEQQLHAEVAVESDTVMLACSGTELDKQVLAGAQSLWTELYSKARKREKPRFDKGVSRALRRARSFTPEKVTEAGFRKRRREGVMNAEAPECVETDPALAWTAGHDREVQFNLKKQMTRLFEAMQTGTVDVNEVGPEIQALAKEHVDKTVKNMLARERAEARMRATIQRRPPSEEELEGLEVWISDALREPLMDQAMDRRGWTTTAHLHEALVVVTDNFTAWTDEMLVAVALRGAWVMSPDMVLRGKGVSLKYQPWEHTKREIFCTAAFQAAHPRVMHVLQHRAGRKLQLLDSIEDFAQAKQKATDKGMPSAVLALIVDSERATYSGVKHCFDVREFKDFIARLDRGRSCPGL
ncbi:ngoBIM [Symbiodinium sp. CCMP2592]|nr:ngoBIM [Symbiodinium sp. CCMP2592]